MAWCCVTARRLPLSQGWRRRGVVLARIRRCPQLQEVRSGKAPGKFVRHGSSEPASQPAAMRTHSIILVAAAAAACAAPADADLVAVPRSETSAPAAVAPPAAPVLRGRVMRDGRPVIGMVVALYEPLDRSPGVHIRVSHALATAVADDDGRFAFASPIPPGDYEICIEDHRPQQFFGSHSPWVARRALTIRAGETLPELDFVLR